MDGQTRNNGGIQMKTWIIILVFSISSCYQGYYQGKYSYRSGPEGEYKTYKPYSKQRIECACCQGQGTLNQDCSSCNGTGRQYGNKCYACNGRGFQKCYACNGKGYTEN